ncbi:MAG: methionyl-tRNA formyltransferase [Candidatus Marinimicrobia bacterium]|jgi:methionyl-tRNA formyltransferase|nr:methionyl-tRNA formyltransferase [Candidatus Neomarinimicrobiota bacterium]MDP6726849.1 methionyl-tRNA formyltransferase [Candidatus Neomarinimicrobiota bacterium]|tara:strand:- start:18056 stop:18982 length:927 start_codon:yes stop_codon:yes gene_type:complete
MKIVFMGNPQFAVPSLRKLVESDHDILSVVTNPPKPAGRGKQLIKSPVAECAKELNLPIIETDELESEKILHTLRDLNGDVFAVVAYRILPKKVINIPLKGAINLHGSLLPKYRGAAPIQWALINGESETGLTTFIIQPKVDKGNILLQKTIKIDQNDNYGSLAEKMSHTGAELLVNTVDRFESENVEPYNQLDSNATMAPKISPALTNISWEKSAKEIHNLIRGLAPFPGARTVLDSKTLKIFKTKYIEENSTNNSGEISNIGKDSFNVQTGKGQLIVLEVQVEGKRRMNAGDFLRGVQLDIGKNLN